MGAVFIVREHELYRRGCKSDDEPLADEGIELGSEGSALTRRVGAKSHRPIRERERKQLRYAAVAEGGFMRDDL